MYPWDVLDIAETNDKKVIKRAYAKLLRKYRPDEHPDDFQKVNQAYQYALQLIKNVSPEPKQAKVNQEYPIQFGSGDDTTPQNTEPELINPHTADSVEVGDMPQADYNDDVELVSPNPINSELIPLDSQQLYDEEVELASADIESSQTIEYLEQQIDDMFKQVHQVAFSSLRERIKIENWKFLEFYNEIHDINLRDQVAKEMFRRVAEYNLFQKKQNNIQLIPNEVMIYMNELYQWEANWQEYEQIFPPHYARSVFADLTQNKSGVSRVMRPTLFNRIMALIVDFMAYFFLMGMLASFLDFGELNQGWLFFLLFAIFRLSTELLSKNRSTLGVGYIGYRFMDQFLNQPSRKTVLKRFAYFELSLLPIYMVFSGWFGGEMGMIILSSYSVVILILAYIGQGQLPHDFMSNTVAVRKY